MSRALGLGLAALALCLGGCGYSVGGLLPAGVESVAVPIAVNETRYRRAEILFTRELTAEIVRRTAWKLVPPERADAVLEARITRIPRFSLVEDRRDAVLEGGVLVEVEATLIDARTGRVLIEPFVVRRRAEHVVPFDEGYEQALDEALRDVARQTLVSLEADGFRRR